MTFKLSKDYAVYSENRSILFQGTYQECLAFQELRDDNTFVDVDHSDKFYELEDIVLDFNYED